MKKLALFNLFLISITSSCGGDDVIDALGLSCINLVSDIVTAEENYDNDPSVVNCRAFKSAIEAFMAEGCSESEDYSDELAMLEDCSS
ncbi:hypothetical protein [Aquimarina sp. RZ0]|uniref:hypothetical protein n=1 Tax=Aquimarina sp. RZ0 TaxID=2607730 RepID=UPI0011F2DDF5|nr:hypothetical protein [Aquimarina sp. RZ0]KAA1247295.1 hypothetical protein F0000_03885 [Aquimarina sp. RZ0]